MNGTESVWQDGSVPTMWPSPFRDAGAHPVVVMIQPGPSQVDHRSLEFNLRKEGVEALGSTYWQKDLRA